MNTHPRCRREGGKKGGNQREQNNKAKRAKAYGNAS